VPEGLKLGAGGAAWIADEDASPDRDWCTTPEESPAHIDVTYRRTRAHADVSIASPPLDTPGQAYRDRIERATQEAGRR
jgi:hypothetical protein